MATEEPAQKLRGERTLLPPWWLDRANEVWRGLKKQGWSLQRLADALTDAYGRELNGERWAWDRKTVERFLENESPTRELMEAFCKLFSGVLLPPTYVAMSEEEARALASVASGFRSAKYSEKDSRRRELAEERAAIEQRVRDQIRTLTSTDESSGTGAEGAGIRGRRGSMGRSRTPTPRS